MFLVLIIAFSAGNIVAAQENAKKDSVVTPAAAMKKEMACPHCTKDKKCDMHSKGEMKEADCKMCAKDKKCDMHSKGEMKEADCKKCMDEKKCDMDKKKTTPAKKAAPAKKVVPKK